MLLYYVILTIVWETRVLLTAALTAFGLCGPHLSANEK